MSALRARNLGLLCALVGLALPRFVRAESLALIVGVNQGQAFNQPLRYADDDALKYADLLTPATDALRLHVAPDVDTAQRRSIGDALPPTRRALLRSVEQLAQVARASGEPTELFFIFVGHGNLDEDGAGYLSLVDGKFTREDLYRQVLDRPEFDRVHVIIDACYAFFIVAGRGETPPEDEAFNRTLLQGSLRSYPHVGVLLSTSGAQQAFEWSRVGGGVFSHALRSALSGAADIDGDGRMSYGEVHAFVQSALQGVREPQMRQKVFIRAPQEAPLGALIDLEKTRYAHFVRVDQPGRFTLESQQAVLVDAHRPAGYTVALAGRGPFYATVSGESFEVRLSGDRRAQLVPSARTRPSARGSKAEALRRGLFAYVFDVSYYRAFSAMADYPVVAARTTNVAWSPPAPEPLALSLQTTAGSALLEGSGPSFGFLAQAVLPFGPHFAVTAGAALDYHRDGQLSFQPTVVHLSIPLGVEGRLRVHESWRILGYADLAYSFVYARGRSETQVYEGSEPAGLSGRAGVGVRYWGGAWGLQASVGARAIWTRVGGVRGWYPGAEGRLGALFRLPW